MNPASSEEILTLPFAVAEIIDTVVQEERRVLLFGQPGAGKSTLASELGRELHARSRECRCISADQGSPGFGVPGAVMLGKWHEDGWLMERYGALCTLDAGRFRLPLVLEVKKLAQVAQGGVLLIDGPGVVRGTPGRELLQGLVEAANIDLVIALKQPDGELPLVGELLSLGCEVAVVVSSVEARRPGQRERARRRTEQWENYLDSSVTASIDLNKMNLIGTPPPAVIKKAWAGRQVAVLRKKHTCAMGEVVSLDNEILQLRLPPEMATGDTLLLRDAARSGEGLLETAEPFLSEHIEYLPPADVVPTFEEIGGLRVAGRVGNVDMALLNGVFGDPLLHLRIRHQGRSLLFDLGGGARLPARMVHQVSDVFISHAHMDHVSGFQWLLRSRLEDLPACRLYGPVGLAKNIEGMINGFLWDRIGVNAPTFIISEFLGDRLERFRIAVGGKCEYLGEALVTDGIILAEPEFRIRAVVLDHHTPVIAFALEQEKTIHVRKDRLRALGMRPGPWLSNLKAAVLDRKYDAKIALPDGSEESVHLLCDKLLRISPGKKLVYATDLQDTPENRRRLIGLAQHAHTFFCEATFTVADAERAERSGHLTTRSCGEIAAAASVARLIPFHFSRRYSENAEVLYEEVSNVCSCVVTPETVRGKGTGGRC